MNRVLGSGAVVFRPSAERPAGLKTSRDALRKVRRLADDPLPVVALRIEALRLAVETPNTIS